MAAETATERDFRRRRIFRLGLSRACHRPPFNNQLSNTSGEQLSDLKLTGSRRYGSQR
jgi:hypothetical protein